MWPLIRLMRRQNCARRHVRGLTEATTASWAASPVLLLPLILSFALCSLSWPRLTSDKDYTLCYNILRGPLGPRDYLLAVLIDSLGSRLSRKILTILCQLNFKKKRASSQTDQKVNAPLPPCKLKTKNLKQLVSLATASQQHLINPSKPFLHSLPENLFPCGSFFHSTRQSLKGWGAEKEAVGKHLVL